MRQSEEEWGGRQNHRQADRPFLELTGPSGAIWSVGFLVFAPGNFPAIIPVLHLLHCALHTSHDGYEYSFLQRLGKLVLRFLLPYT